ncbi:hypothetical protein CLHOM_19670 [Clostridium homopropionicum DSM 5847]|uniref:50S ribosomal protein L14e n=1 Tax=Clostridium homopropionicum DSM 5847 TaxID=1121318 RepID=A0A0L6ZAR3_9CLOT|nr:hypothetical protein CLHOM_19670 [Clostridium homopropionicum DSM 5847]SFF75482.1 hypothetical protein SAMN04488501_10226 [Clostridium homopropionicum]
MYNEDLIGKVVYSKAGRDSGRPFMILNILNDEYVSIVDGELRKIEKPKKKKLKHLIVTKDVLEDIKELIISGENISNVLIRKCLVNRCDNKEG